MRMTENKRYTVKGTDDFFLHIEDTTFTEDKHEGSIYNIYQVVRRLNEQDERILELENKLNQTALEFLNYEIITMGKAVEISEMSYHDFIKYRAEHGNPMELQL